MNNMKAEITEIFSSLQGEGPYAGEKQIFVRFKRCNLRCAYCDEHREEFEELAPTEVLERIEALNIMHGPHRFISWTGGEPTLYFRFLREVLPALKQKGYQNYLETNGTLPEVLEELLPNADVVAMDIKLPSMTKDNYYWAEHEMFLKKSRASNLFAKIVLSKKVNLKEFDQAVEILSKTRPETLLVLQPLSSGEAEMVSSETINFLEKLKERALLKLSRVQVIKRLHKILEIK